MNIFLIILFGAGVVTHVYSNAIPSESEEKSFCPPKESIHPCTCFKAEISNRITARCSNFTNSDDLKGIFNGNPNWKIQDVWIDHCTLQYLPAKMLEQAYFQSLKVFSCTFVTLFDTTPVTTPELNLYISDVKIVRSFQWKDIANSNLLDLVITNMTIKILGQDFKDNIPKDVPRLWFENTGITSIKNQAFSQLHNLEFLIIKHGSLKKLSRDWFPKPWKVIMMDFSYQKISSLPEDFFTDLSQLKIFSFEGNLLTTISENLFTNTDISLYNFDSNPIDCNCNIKWIIVKRKLVVARCAEPESLKGRELKSLKEENFIYCF